MFDAKFLRKLDFKTLPIIVCIMIISLCIISSATTDGKELMTRYVKGQLRAFGIGFIVYMFFVCFDYRKLKQYAPVTYVFILLLLIGLFFTDPIQHVHRWYRFPLISFALQPSEFGKIIVIITLSWFLEKNQHNAYTWKTAIIAGVIVLIPFILILKQPDLGSAMILYPITLGIFYLGNIRKEVMWIMNIIGILGLVFVFLMFSNVIPHDEFKPVATKFLKEYQYERLNPNTYHQKAGQTAIALGSVFGSGWCKSEFTGKKWLPFAHTDSVFCAFAEEFGLVGATVLLGLFFTLIYFSFQVVAVAKDLFGRLLSAGFGIYLAMHVIINVGMMCGFLPITGVPLILVTYGGSSVLVTMIALGILQSIYTRRYMF
ncbi:MAG: rod shape-determining protein RodA [Chlamydiales bacterium]|nr:rod shape-determining protein RodA [Chlamydiales bacterium]